MPLTDCHPLDRVTPTLRPPGPPQGYQQWRTLLFLHWTVPIQQVRKLVPEPLELDLWQDQAYVGLVPFAMSDIRPAWWPAGCGLRFLETNVRTYVHYRGRPGVYFFSLDANSAPAVWAARRGWSLPYYLARLQLRRSEDTVSYRLRRGRAATLDLSYRVGEPLGDSQPGTLEHFFLERYLLFVQRNGQLHEGQVHHVPYPAHRAELLSLNESLLTAAGFDGPNRSPELIHFSPGVDVEVFPLRPLPVV